MIDELLRLARWLLLCRGGRGCANIIVTSIDGDQPPAGSMIEVEYECGGCRTLYRGSLLIGNDGAFTETLRTRTRERTIR